MNTDAKKIPLTSVVLSKSARKNFFFFTKFLDQSEIANKSNSIIRLFLSFESRDRWTLMLKKFYWPLLYYRNSRERIFFLLKFSDQSEIEKNQIQLFDFFVIRIERPMNTDAKKISLTSVVLSKSARKKFFFSQNFWTNQNSWNNRIQLFDFFCHSSRETNEHWC